MLVKRTRTNTKRRKGAGAAPNTMNIITLNLLMSLGACVTQVELFAEIFPNGAPLTEETARLVIKTKDFEVFWLMQRVPARVRPIWDEARAKVIADRERRLADLREAYPKMLAELRSASRADVEYAAIYESIRKQWWIDICMAMIAVLKEITEDDVWVPYEIPIIMDDTTPFLSFSNAERNREELSRFTTDIFERG